MWPISPGGPSRRTRRQASEAEAAVPRPSRRPHAGSADAGTLILSRISRQDRAFLARTAVLERMCGPLCDAVLEQSGSAEALADLARSNLLLVPLDRRGKWYRYHHLFRDMLRAELDRMEPELIPVLRRRAAAWCVRNDLPESALEYSIAAGDVDTVADLTGRLVLPTYQQGRVTTVQRWFRWLQDRGGIGKHPMAAVLASVVSAVTGRPTEAERWADMVDRWQFGDGARPDDPPAEAWAALVRAVLCRGGVMQMRADADEAVRRFAAEGIKAPIASLCQGLARILSGDLDGGDASFADAVVIATEAGAPEGLAEALSERSLLAMACGEWSRAEVLADQAHSTLRQAGIEDSYATTLVCAVAARVAVRRGEVQTARQLQHAIYRQPRPSRGPASWDCWRDDAPSSRRERPGFRWGSGWVRWCRSVPTGWSTGRCRRGAGRPSTWGAA